VTGIDGEWPKYDEECPAVTRYYRGIDENNVEDIGDKCDPEYTRKHGHPHLVVQIF
jgi:hypothetical protein